jgi:hypothetical protein
MVNIIIRVYFYFRCCIHNRGHNDHLIRFLYILNNILINVSEYSGLCKVHTSLTQCGGLDRVVDGTTTIVICCVGIKIIVRIRHTYTC